MKIEELIEELEMLRRKVQPSVLSSEEYRAVGWANRPLRQLIDQCREEAEALTWADRHAKDFAGPDPKLMMPAPLPLQAMETVP